MIVWIGLVIYLVVGVLAYIVLVNMPGASGGSKRFAALAALLWPLAVVWTLLHGD